MAPKTTLYLIRHGQSAGNAEGRFGGHSATPLSELGHRQADITAKALSKERVTVIYSSDLERAVQTATALSEVTGLPVNKTDVFRERNIGVLEGLTFDEAEQEFPGDYKALVDRNIVHVITRGESYRQLVERVSGAVDEILEKHKGGKIAVFAHTGTICFLTLHLIGALNPETVCTPWIVTSNCGINKFEFRGRDNLRVLSLNDTRHLSQQSGNDAFAAR
ncbi:MAG TPA: histidine phosphatase family protein [Pyrinomonadaceae bacterium]|jgi:broad specificity phosphatase PhoE|nr:histidine phosphatase family protein [Pyrinomonadaceae bacterium]